MCRLDIDHGATAAFARDHSSVRFEVYNTTINGINLDIDYATMANPVQRITSTTGDQAPVPAIGSACTPALLYV
jgi:hypothetical protein